MRQNITPEPRRDSIPIPMWQKVAPRTQVILVDAGVMPWLVAELMREVMSITVAPEALADATPVVLYRELDGEAAEALLLRFELAGAQVDLRPVHVPKQGFPIIRSRRSAPAKAA